MVYLAYRKREALMPECQSQERACTYHCIFGSFLTEIFHCANCIGAVLHFIKNKKRLMRQYRFFGEKGQLLYYPNRVLGGTEYVADTFLFVKTEVNTMLKLFFPKLFQYESLADLSCTKYYQRLPVFTVFPGLKLFYDGSIKHTIVCLCAENVWFYTFLILVLCKYTHFPHFKRERMLIIAGVLFDAGT